MVEVEKVVVVVVWSMMRKKEREREMHFWNILDFFSSKFSLPKSPFLSQMIFFISYVVAVMTTTMPVLPRGFRLFFFFFFAVLQCQGKTKKLGFLRNGNFERLLGRF